MYLPYLSMQDYLREQPDNVKSFNIIGEVTQFLNVIYSNIKAKSIDLVIQLFDTMTEFTAVSDKLLLIRLYTFSTVLHIFSKSSITLPDMYIHAYKRCLQTQNVYFNYILSVNKFSIN